MNWRNAILGENKTMSKEIATLAGGCFWCMLEPFDERPESSPLFQAIPGAAKKIRRMRK